MGSILDQISRTLGAWHDSKIGRPSTSSSTAPPLASPDATPNVNLRQPLSMFAPIESSPYKAISSKKLKRQSTIEGQQGEYDVVARRKRNGPKGKSEGYPAKEKGGSGESESPKEKEPKKWKRKHNSAKRRAEKESSLLQPDVAQIEESLMRKQDEREDEEGRNAGIPSDDDARPQLDMSRHTLEEYTTPPEGSGKLTTPHASETQAERETPELPMLSYPYDQYDEGTIDAQPKRSSKVRSESENRKKGKKRDKAKKKAKKKSMDKTSRTPAPIEPNDPERLSESSTSPPKNLDTSIISSPSQPMSRSPSKAPSALPRLSHKETSKTPNSDDEGNTSTKRTMSFGLTAAEQANVRDAVQLYQLNNVMTDSDLVNLIHKARDNKNKHPFWTEILNAAPDAKSYRVHRYCRKSLYPAPNIRRDKWEPEEELDLERLHAQYGNRWKIIGEHLGRAPEDARKRFNNHVGCARLRTGHWTADEENKLREVVNELMDEVRKEREKDKHKNPLQVHEEVSHKDVMFTNVSDRMGGKRNPQQCLKKWKRINKLVEKEGARRTPQKKILSEEFVRESASPESESRNTHEEATQSAMSEGAESEDERSVAAESEILEDNHEKVSESEPPTPERVVEETEQSEDDSDD